MNIQQLITNNKLNSLESLKTFFENKNISVKGNNDRAVLLSSDSEKLSKEADGCVIDVENMKIVCYNPYFGRYELNPEQLPTSDEKWESTVEELIDGTVIRIYYDLGEWQIATLRTSDASKAYFYSDKSFKDLFLECAENFLSFDKLNTSYIYGFIIRHPENKIVTHYESKDLVHIFTIDRENDFKSIDIDLNIIKPRKLIFTSFDQMIQSCLNLMYYLPGYLVTDKDGNKMKYISPHYTHVKNLKGNSPNMKVRYLQIRKTGKQNEFVMYYPELMLMVQTIEKDIIKLCETLYQKYVDIKIKKKWYDLTKIEKQIIYHIHEIYLNNRQPMNFQTVYHYFNNLPYYKIAMALDIPLHPQKN